MKKTKVNWDVTDGVVNEALKSIDIFVSNLDSDDAEVLCILIIPEVYAGIKKHKRLSYKVFKHFKGSKLTKKDKRLYDDMVKAVKKVMFK